MSDAQVTPNLYELSSSDTEVSYATSGIGGQPTLTYRSGDREARSFTGEDIDVARTRLGTEVTVVLVEISRAGRHTELTLLLPEVVLADRRAAEELTALAIHTTKLIPEVARHGSRQSYEAFPLAGTARAVEFVA